MRLKFLFTIAYAGLGRKEEAMRAGRLTVEMAPVRQHSLRNLIFIEMLAKTYVLVAEYEAAINQLEYLLANPSNYSTEILKLDPIWDPLRDHPGYQRLLERYSRSES